LCTYHQSQDRQYHPSITNGLGCEINKSITASRLWRMQGYEIIILNHLNFNQVKNQKEIIVPIMYYIDDETNKKVYDFEEMTSEFEKQLSELDDSVVVMCSVELDNDLYERSAE
jgi:hypothetical protein